MKNKLTKLLMLLCVLYVIESIGQSTKSSIKEKENSYLQKIKPNNKVTTGINKGSLILYGQWVQAPYEVKVQEEKLFINDVRVVPPIMPPWKEVNKPVVTNAIQQIADFTDEIKREYRGLKTNFDDAATKSNLLQFVVSNKHLIHSAEWVGENHLHIVTTKDIEFSMNFAEKEPISKKKQSNMLMADKALYEDQLKNGDLLLFGYGANINVPHAKVEEYATNIKTAIVNKDAKALKALVQSEALVNELLFISK